MVESPEIERWVIPAEAVHPPGSSLNVAETPSPVATKPRLRPEKLTARETEVLKLIADGKSTKETAAILGITFKTAACHRSRMLSKFGVHETVSLVRCAIRRGIIQA